MLPSHYPYYCDSSPGLRNEYFFVHWCDLGGSSLKSKWKVVVDYSSPYPYVGDDKLLSDENVAAYHRLLKVLYFDLLAMIRSLLGEDS